MLAYPLDLHRHTEYSSFDGFGKSADLAKLAKEKGIKALGISDHGNVNGLVFHWKACKENDILPILGVEAYFQPKFNRKEPSNSSFHLCIFARNLEGYKNLNRIMTAANIKQKYKKPLVDFGLLEKYGKGLIITSGCIASFISQTIVKGKLNIAKKTIEKFISIVGKDNFYIEVQPYGLDKEGLQEKVNIQLIKFAKEYGLRIVLASDSHYGSENDYDTYMKMHEIKESDDFAGNTYEERFMPNKNDLIKRFVKMHKKDFKDIDKLTDKIISDAKKLIKSIEPNILGQLELELPRVHDNSAELLWDLVVKGLKEKKLYNKKYLKRCKEEYDVIVYHGFEDYFLIVSDYTNYAKNKGIKVGPGRGSVCNSALAFAINITEVDALYFDLDFSRFLRMDKKKLPDIDLDFETDRRDEVIQYIVKTYPGKAAQICSYGLYKVDNLLNDLAKPCGVGKTEYDAKGKAKFVTDSATLKEIKSFVKKYVEDNEFKYDEASRQSRFREFNRLYDNILIHFSKMFGKVKYIGTHAAGVAVVGGKLLDYTSLESRGGKINKATGKREGAIISTAYDLNNLEAINVIKFDMLGLRTLSITKELEEMTNECFSYEWLEDESVYEYFKEGKTDGIFQFERDAAKGILKTISADCFNDVSAASALNRPGPLSLRMHDTYAAHKESGEYDQDPWSKYTKNTYGTIVYQEQTLAIAKNIGLMDPAEADKILKFMKGQNSEGLASLVEGRKREEERLKNAFRDGAKQTLNLSKTEADELFEKLLTYTFNQGHAVGYSLISLQQMYFKAHHPELFWYVTLKYAANESDLFRLKIEAVREGNIILIPHVNYGAKYSIVQVEGENALAEGLSNIKNVGAKAAEVIEQERLANGKFKNREDFLNRIKYKGSPVNVGVIKALEEAGALVFSKSTYFERVKKWNSQMYMMGNR